MVKGLILMGVCAAAVQIADGRGLLNASSAPAGGAPVAATAAPAQATATATATATEKNRPQIRGMANAERAWLGAEHRGLTVQKVANRSDRSIAIELRYRQDAVAIDVDARGTVTVARGRKRVRLTTPESFEQLQQVLAGSEAVFAARVLHAERESTSDLKAGEMSLLSVTAFVASLMGDVDAPHRLATRFVERHRGIYRPVRSETCFDEYSREASAAWNDLQDCMSEANQDESIFNRAYRRVACNATWLLRSESAWIEYLGCLGPGQLIPS